MRGKCGKLRGIAGAIMASMRPALCAREMAGGHHGVLNEARALCAGNGSHRLSTFLHKRDYWLASMRPALCAREMPEERLNGGVRRHPTASMRPALCAREMELSGNGSERRTLRAWARASMRPALCAREMAVRGRHQGALCARDRRGRFNEARALCAGNEPSLQPSPYAAREPTLREVVATGPERTCRSARSGESIVLIV